MNRASSEERYDAGLGGIAPSPAIIVPAQLFDGAPGRHVPAGVRSLMVAILEDAIDVYSKHRGAVLRDKRTLHLRARRWFASEDRSHVFSFLRITEALGIDASLVRKALLQASATSPQRLTRLDTRSAGCRGSSG